MLSRTNLIVILTVLIAGLVVLALTSSDDEACIAWLERYAAAQAESQGGGVFDFTNQGPLAELRAQRPEGCAIPE